MKKEGGAELGASLFLISTDWSLLPDWNAHRARLADACARVRVAHLELDDVAILERRYSGL
jgi:hypothetical protein